MVRNRTLKRDINFLSKSRCAMMSTHEAEYKYFKLFRYCITERRRQSSPENILNIDYERLILDNQIHNQFMQLPYEEGQHEFTSVEYTVWRSHRQIKRTLLKARNMVTMLSKE